MATTKTTTKTTSTPKAVTTQGTKTAAGIVNYNPNTGAKLKAGESVVVNPGGNTYGSNISRSYDTKYTSGSPANPQINAENINTKAMNVPPPPVAENYMGTLLGANTSLANQELGTNTDKNGIVTTTPVEPTVQADGGLGDIFKQYQELSNNLQSDAPNAESIYNKSLKESGLRKYQQEAQNYSSQINAITAKAQADILSTTGQGRGIPEAIIGGQQAQISKEAAIQALPLQALLANAQGNVELAQSHLDTLFKIRFEDAKTKHEYKTKLLDSAMQVASKQEQRQYEAIQKADDRKYAEQVKNTDTIKDITKQALSNGAPASVLNALAGIDMSSPTAYADSIKIAGKYGGDYLRAEMLREQIKTEKAQQSNIYSTIASRKEADALARTPGGGKPPTDAQVQNAGYADRIAQANTIIDSKAATLSRMNYAQFKLIESNSQLANSLLSDDQRQAGQAMRNFITAKLRKESGASISPSEFADARVQYFPALGDDAQTLANKKALRDSVLKNNILGAGSAYTGQTPINSTTTESNPFSQALGISSSNIPGTSIIGGFNSNGTINFSIPK